MDDVRVYTGTLVADLVLSYARSIKERRKPLQALIQRLRNHDFAVAQVGLDNAQENLRKTRLQVEEEVRSGLIALRTAYQGYQIALRSQEIAQERLRLAREQFRLGSRTFSELQLDIDAGASAEREVITQLFGFLEAGVNLEETVGDLEIGGGV